MGQRQMSALEFLNRIQQAKSAITKEEVSRIMREGDAAKKEELWKEIEKAGGYDALADK